MPFDWWTGDSMRCSQTLTVGIPGLHVVLVSITLDMPMPLFSD